MATETSINAKFSWCSTCFQSQTVPCLNVWSKITSMAAMKKDAGISQLSEFFAFTFSGFLCFRLFFNNVLVAFLLSVVCPWHMLFLSDS